MSQADQYKTNKLIATNLHKHSIVSDVHIIDIALYNDKAAI